MSTTTESAERLSLRGLLLLVVELQNQVRAEYTSAQNIRDLVESDHTREMVQLARAALGSVPAVAAIPADQASTHN